MARHRNVWSAIAATLLVAALPACQPCGSGYYGMVVMLMGVQ